MSLEQEDDFFNSNHYFLTNDFQAFHNPLSSDPHPPPWSTVAPTAFVPVVDIVAHSPTPPAVPTAPVNQYVQPYPSIPSSPVPSQPWEQLSAIQKQHVLRPHLAQTQPACAAPSPSPPNPSLSNSPSSTLSAHENRALSKKRDRVCDLPDEECSPEQLRKRNRRRELNKQAAQQSRKRKEDKKRSLEEEIVRLMEDKVLMDRRIRDLEGENVALKQQVQTQQQTIQELQQQQQQQQHLQQQQQQQQLPHLHQQPPQILQQETPRITGSTLPRQLLNQLFAQIPPVPAATHIEVRDISNTAFAPGAPIPTPALPLGRKPLLALMTLSLVAVFVFHPSYRSEEKVSISSRHLQSTNDNQIPSMSWHFVNPSPIPSRNTSNPSVDATPQPSPVPSSVFPLMTIPAKGAFEFEMMPSVLPSFQAETEIEDDMLGSLITYKYSTYDLHQAAQYLRAHGKIGTTYLLCPKVHLVELLVDDSSSATQQPPPPPPAVPSKIESHVMAMTLPTNLDEAPESAPLDSLAHSVGVGASIRSAGVPGQVVLILPAGLVSSNQNVSDDGSAFAQVECHTEPMPSLIAPVDLTLPSFTA